MGQYLDLGLIILTMLGGKLSQIPFPSNSLNTFCLSRSSIFSDWYSVRR